jgi:hypothetical protein
MVFLVLKLMGWKQQRYCQVIRYDDRGGSVTPWM